MKLRFNRQETADALRACCTVAPVRTPKPVLRCVRIVAREDVVWLSATDLEVGLRWAVSQVEVDEPGETLVVADTLSRIVSECDDELLSLELADNKLHIRGEGSHFQVVTQDVAEFPAVPELDQAHDFTVEHGVLRKLIDVTVFACARESTRYAINGVLWELEDDCLTLAATDGRRLALARGKVAREGGGTDKVPTVIVPAKALSLFGRLPVEDDATVKIKVTTNQLLLDWGRGVVSTSLVEGHFPKYQDVIPSDCDRVMRVKTADFMSALKRAALLTNEESKGVRLSVDDDSMTLASRAPEQGEATVSVAVRYKSGPLEIGFNPTFLMDFLRVVDADEIEVAFKDSNRPGVLKLGDDIIYVVMPVSLASA